MNEPSKYEQILATAGELFLKEGFRKVSIDRIVQAVPVSKPTLYAHFKDKNDLFRAVIESRTQALLTQLEASFKAANNIDEYLYACGHTYLSMVMSQGAVDMFRITAAECGEFPEMATLFYDSGPRKAFDHFTHAIAELHLRGIIHAPDAERAADMFISTLKGKLHLQRLLGLCAAPPPEVIEAQTRYAVQVFLTAHHVPATP